MNVYPFLSELPDFDEEIAYGPMSDPSGDLDDVIREIFCSVSSRPDRRLV